MVCANCGKNLIRGYAFCMECGSPVPPEVLEEGGMPGRTDNEGRPQSDAENAPKPENKDGEKKEAPAGDVQSSMPGIGSFSDSNSTETLVFCPNCGMHMQDSTYKCNKCGMTLGEKPKNVPLSAGGVPLMNTDPTGGLGGIGGGLDGISESDIEQITGFMSGTGNIPIFAVEDDPTPDLFGSDISANDFAALSEQLANFSAANDMPSIDAIDAVERINKAETEKPAVERRVDDFNMSGGSSALMTDNSVPVIGNYSMDEIPEENVDLDPYKFLNASMEDVPEPTIPTPQTVPSVPAVEPEHVREKPVELTKPTVPERVPEPVQPPVTVQNVQTAPPKAPEPPIFPEAAPVITENAPVIGEFVSEQTAPPPYPKAPETAKPSGADDFFSQPVPPMRQNTAPVHNEAPRGNLFRCRFCGQSMYDTDKFCPNCGASYKNGSSSKGKSKAPLIIGIIIAVIALAAAGYFALTFLNNGNGSESSTPASDSSVVSDTPEPSESTSEESGDPEPSSVSTPSAPSSGGSTGAPNNSNRPSSTGGAPNSSTGAPNSSTGAPPSSTGASGSSRPSSTGGSSNSTGMPSSSGGSTPGSSGGAPNSTGGSTGAPNSTGTQGSSSRSSSTGGAPQSTGAPNSSR